MSGVQSHSRKERELRVWSGQKDSDKRRAECQATDLNVQSYWEDCKPQRSERARPLSERWSETVTARCRDARGGSRCNRKKCARHWKWWKISQINPEPVSVFPDYITWLQRFPYSLPKCLSPIWKSCWLHFEYGTPPKEMINVINWQRAQ